MLLVQLRFLLATLSFSRFLKAGVLTLVKWKHIKEKFLTCRSELGVLAPSPKTRGGIFIQIDMFHDWMEDSRKNMNQHHPTAQRIIADNQIDLDTASIEEIVFHDFGFVAYVRDSWQSKQQQYNAVDACYLDALNMYGMPSSGRGLAMLTPTYP